MPSGPRSAPTSPLKSRPGAGGASASASPRRFPVRRADSRAVQAAAVAAALVYGAGGAQGSNFQAADLEGNSKEVAQLDSAKCASRQVARPGSSCLLAGMLNRPASAGAACCDCRAGQGSGMRSAGTSCDPASKRSRAVEMQVAETHAIIAGIQNQSKQQGFAVQGLRLRGVLARSCSCALALHARTAGHAPVLLPRWRAA